MNYIEHLTEKEINTLCNIISGKKFKKLFEKDEQNFSKIYGGFRAKTLKEDQALSIAKKNVKSQFISDEINNMLTVILTQIQNNINSFEKKGIPHDEAIASALLDSIFSNNIELFFKLTDDISSEDEYSIISEIMKDIAQKRSKEKDISEQLIKLETANQDLITQLELADQKLNATRTEYEETIRELEKTNNSLKSMLDEANATISELQSTPEPLFNNDIDELAKYDDTNTSFLPSNNSTEITSLCSVFTNYNGKTWLKRHADLNVKGRYYSFRQDKNSPPYFENRDLIFHFDGPTDLNFYGLWTWSVTTNENDESKDFVKSQYNNQIDAIEIIIISEAKSLDDLVQKLKSGIECTPHSRKVFFSLPPSRDQYTGVLCSANDYINTYGITTVSEKCYIAPIYKFSTDDVLHLDNGISFYQNAFAGIPVQLYHLKNTMEIVRDIVYSSISWNAYKNTKVTRAEYRTFKDFIGAIPVNDIINNINTDCHCNVPTAKKLLDEFLEKVWLYLDGKTIDNDIIRAAISTNTDLQEKAKELVQQDWEKENSQLLEESQQKLNTLNNDLKIAEDKLKIAQKDYNETKSKDKNLSDSILAKEKLVNDIDVAISEHIQKARENVADFIADMAFVSGQKIQIEYADSVPRNEISSSDEISAYRVYPESDHSDLESHHNWNDVIETVSLELSEAGVRDQYGYSLAAFLCAAYINKQPLLLIGPNALDIIQAFCAAVTAYKHGILSCEGNFSYQSIEKIGKNSEKIVIINNLFANNCINRLPEILSKKEIFYVATHPYAEDIQVEPKSLYGFMLPLFTEPLVDKSATSKYIGGYFASDFKKPEPKDKNLKEVKILPHLPLSVLVRSQINSLASTMNTIYPDSTPDDDFLFFILPISYASMEISVLSEIISGSHNEYTISTNLKRDLKYLLGKN